jgi:uncharacterized membrane protein
LDSNLRILFRQPKVFAQTYRLELFILLIGASADAVTTLINVSRYGADIEVHPVQRLFFHLFGPVIGVLSAKVGQWAFVLFVAAWWRPWCTYILLATGLLYFVAALSNHFMWL